MIEVCIEYCHSIKGREYLNLAKEIKKGFPEDLIF